MSVSATLNGEVVSIVYINGNGSNVYVTYIDNSAELRFTKVNWELGGSAENSLLIASAASII